MPTHEELTFALRRVIDPELGINIIDLGLVYEAACVDGVARVRMTMTTPACPMGPYLTEEVQRALGDLPGVGSVEVDLVFEPLWSPEQMSPEAKEQLGFGG
jgi:metal-sulfur cluster biosynthetic enzyme